MLGGKKNMMNVKSWLNNSTANVLGKTWLELHTKNRWMWKHMHISAKTFGSTEVNVLLLICLCSTMRNCCFLSHEIKPCLSLVYVNTFENFEIICQVPDHFIISIARIFLPWYCSINDLFQKFFKIWTQSYCSVMHEGLLSYRCMRADFISL